MKCSELQFDLALYADGFHGGSVAAHLDVCPLCRLRHEEFNALRSRLRQLGRPEMPATLRNSLRTAIHAEQRSWLPFSPGMREWLQMRVMPYGVGAFASVLIGVAFLWMMFSGILKSGNMPVSSEFGSSSVLLASNTNPYRDAEISPFDFAQTRLGFGGESPSVNPQGALVAMTRSLVNNGGDGEVVVVADVFSNGIAQIAEVVEPSGNKRAIEELQKALESDSAFAPFVPARMENRPESVRVVLKFQSVNIDTAATPKAKRRR